MYLDPLFRESYPDDVMQLLGGAAPFAEPEDLRRISVPIDFIGINLYRRSVIAAGDELPPINYRRINPPGEYTLMGWEVSQNALHDALIYVNERYARHAFYVTENGAAFDDVVSSDGRIHDERRVDYFRNHVVQAQRAITDGIPLKGYFAWSLLDNFEWAYGYSRRFGIVHVDFAAQQRTIKDSGYYLSEVAARNAVT